MACNITKGKIELACKDAIGGLKAIYFSNYGSHTFVMGTASGTANELQITDITTGPLGGVGGSAGTAFFKYELKNTGNTISQDVRSSRDTGTTVFEQTLTAILTKLDLETEYQLKMMAYGRPRIVIETNGGDFILIGLEHGVEITYTGEVGGELDGMNGYTITGVSQGRYPYLYLNSNARGAIFAITSGNNI